jgi:hypothetical protein
LVCVRERHSWAARLAEERESVSSRCSLNLMYSHVNFLADFTVTIPNLGTQCATVGKCAIQWWWWGTQVKQTYESCVDFTQ